MTDSDKKEHKPVANDERKAEKAEKYFFRASANDFKKIPGAPIAYWLSKQAINAFSKYPSLASVAPTKQGLATGDNNRFLRLWHEVEVSKIAFDCSSSINAKKQKEIWYPCNKGGEFRKWFGNNWFVVNWHNSGYAIKNFYDENGKLKSRPQNEQFYFVEGLTWSSISSSNLSMRYSPSYQMFETKGAMCFPSHNDIYSVLGFTNSHIVNGLLLALAPTLDFHEGPIGRLAYNACPQCISLVKNAVEISKTDWDSRETSWDFQRLPLLLVGSGQCVVGREEVGSGQCVVGREEVDSGQCVVGREEVDSGQCVVGREEVDSGQCVVGREEVDSGQCVVGREEVDSGQCVVGRKEVGSGQCVVGREEVDSCGGRSSSLSTNHYPLPTNNYPLSTNHYPLTTNHYPLPTTLSDAYTAYRQQCREMTAKMKELEEENNRIFIDAYGLQDELTPDVPIEEITLFANPKYRYRISGQWEVGSEQYEQELERRFREDTIKELISYAVGCMMGRYSLDEPGLILANQGETLVDFIRKVGREEVGSGQWVVGRGEVDSGQWVVGREEVDSGQCVVGSEEVDSGQWVVGSEEVGSGQCVVGSEEVDSGQCVVGSKEVDSGQWVVGSEEVNRKEAIDGNSTELSGVDCLAEGNEIGGKCISANKAVSEGRDVCSDQPDPSGSSFDTLQYSRRTSTSIEGGISKFLVNCPRFKSGTGDANPACPAFELCQSATGENTTESSGRSSQTNQRTAKQPEITHNHPLPTNHYPLTTITNHYPLTTITNHCPLSTIHFLPDDDGIIPITDFAWFDDDAAERFFEFVATVWKKETLNENLDFVAEAIGRKTSESSREAIRRFFCNDFFKDHLKRYKRRPIYWLFSSGKQKALQCLVYLHRYNEGTLARMRTEYLIPLQAKIASRIESLNNDIEYASSTSAANKIRKEIIKLEKQAEELRKFDEKLRHYADKKIKLDLDDGVKVNYGKFGDLLAEVKAVTGKKPNKKD